jgi:hypothetical protein
VACAQSPETTLAYALCTTEHFCGLILSSLLLGVVVTKASIPTGKIVFSKVCLITTRCAHPFAPLAELSWGFPAALRFHGRLSLGCAASCLCAPVAMVPYLLEDRRCSSILTIDR